MFRALVSSLSLSPSAVSQLAFYARRLKKEKITRLFSVLAAILVVGLQFATITLPPTSASANSASPSDIINGGVTSKADLLANYDAKNSTGTQLRGIFTRFGITRADIASPNTKKVWISSTDHSYNSLSRVNHGNATKLTISNVDYYYRPLYYADRGIASGSKYEVIAGTRSGDGGYFAVMMLCGNLVFKTVPKLPTPKPTPVPTKPPTPKPTPTPTPSPGLACVELTGDISEGEAPLKVSYTSTATATNQTITSYIYDFGDNATQTTPAAKTTHIYGKAGTFKATLLVKGSLGTTTKPSVPCSFTVTVSNKPAQIIESKTAENITQNVPAASKPANPLDQIKYTLTTKNIGGSAIDFVVTDDITDILEYAEVTDFGGGKLVERAMVWPSQSIAAGATVTKTFTVTIKSPVPTTPMGTSDRYSFDLRMDNFYGNEIQVPIQPPVAKEIEKAVNNLPATGAGTTTTLVLIIAALAFFFYLRNRQLMAEVKILRHDYQGGA